MTQKLATKKAKTKWLETRRTLLRHVKSQVRKRLGPEPGDVALFNRRYEKEIHRPWVVSSQSDLALRIEESNLIYGGDFHALAQAQRAHLRLLRNLRHHRPVILALECFHSSSQRILDQFTAKKITLDDLRRKTNWDETWGFPWDHYRPLFELARARGFRLLGVNSRAEKDTRDLASREEHAAKIIADAWAKAPEALMYVIFGDLHLAPEHLPSKVAARMKKSKSFRPPFRVRDLTVHLNSEKIYFQLAEREQELVVDVVKLSEKSFCLLSTPPWVKWQSYLLFLERETPLATPDDDSLDDEIDFDPTDQVALLVRLAASDLGLEKVFKTINDLAVYGDDDEIIWREVEKRTTKSTRKQAQEFLKERRSFFLPSGGVAYLPNPSINAAAAMAGFYLHAKLSKRKRPLLNFPDDLSALTWTESVSYFISKLINHSRRSETVSSLRSKLHDRSQNIEALKLALDVRLSEILRLQSGRKPRSLKIRPRQTSSSLEAARILGGMLGERLYLAYRSRKLKRELLIRWMKRDPSSRNFIEVYDEIVSTLAMLG